MNIDELEEALNDSTSNDPIPSGFILCCKCSQVSKNAFTQFISTGTAYGFKTIHWCTSCARKYGLLGF